MVGRVSIRIGESAPGLSPLRGEAFAPQSAPADRRFRLSTPRPSVFVTLRDRLCFNIRAAQRGALFHHRIYPRNIMKLRACLATLLFLCIVVGDQVIKYLVKTGMSLGERIHVTDWFYILFTENHGMAFGMDFIGTAVLSIFRVAAVGLFTYVLVKQIRRSAPLGFVVCLSLIIAGAFGNIIDNFFYGLCFTESFPQGLGAVPAHCVPMGKGYGTFLHGRVVDMFYFPFFTWPDWVPVLGGGTFFGAIFNLADSAISVGAVAMILFYYKYLSVLLGGRRSTSPSPEDSAEEGEKQA